MEVGPGMKCSDGEPEPTNGFIADLGLEGRTTLWRFTTESLPALELDTIVWGGETFRVDTQSSLYEFILSLMYHPRSLILYRFVLIRFLIIMMMKQIHTVTNQILMIVWFGISFEREYQRKL